MTRFLIATWDGGGNTTPALNLGARLLRRGHDVEVLGWPAMAPRVTSAGLGFRAYPSLPPWRNLPDLDAHLDLLAECLNGDAARRDIVSAARGFKTDVLVLDCMLGAGFDALGELEVGSAALVHISYEQFAHEWGSGMMGRDVLGMMEPCGAVLALQPPGFDPPRPLPAGHEYVGAITNPDPPPLNPGLEAALSSPGEPWVLVSLSTTTQRGQLEALQGILGGLAAMPVRVLVTLGGPISVSELRQPANALAAGFVPHERVLPLVSAVVTHAGMSTVAAALGAGRPLVCVPLGRDQGGNAARVAAIGAGLATSPNEAPAAVARVLRNPSYRAAAEGVQRAGAPLAAGEHGAEMVEQLAMRRPELPIGPSAGR